MLVLKIQIIVMREEKVLTNNKHMGFLIKHNSGYIFWLIILKYILNENLFLNVVLQVIRNNFII